MKLTAHCTYGDTPINQLFDIQQKRLSIFMASLVKRTAMHRVSILPYFNFYGVSLTGNTTTGAMEQNFFQLEPKLVFWMYSIFAVKLI